jgi:hypothetical protein
MQLRITYRKQRVITPVTPWVHTGVDGPWWRATRFEPPMPSPIPDKGYPVWTLSHRGRELIFASHQEIAHAVEILDRKILPLSRELGRPFRAVNSHWLSRLHKSWKSWKVRQEIVRRLRSAPTA